jgi:hypothetical protein
MIQRTMASQEDLKTVNLRLDGIDSHLDRIEHLLLAEQNRKIDDLEARMKKTRGRPHLLAEARSPSHTTPQPPLNGGFCSVPSMWSPLFQVRILDRYRAFASAL